MGKNSLRIFSLLIFFVVIAGEAMSDTRQSVYNLGLELERHAAFIAQSSFEHFKGRNNTISDEEQAVLFESEAFVSSCRLFLRLAGDQSDYYSAGFLRTNLYNAFTYLAHSFRDLEESTGRAGVRPSALSDCRTLLNRMDAAFSQWPSPDNLAYLDQKYVKAADASVYLIERKGPGLFVRHAFKNLESLYRYNYDLKRGKNPWKYLVEVSEDTLEKMEEGRMIALSFEGSLIIEQSSRPGRGVYLIENGKKRGLANPQVVQRLGGWSKVLEVPAEVIADYPDGDPIN
jgi:hypothetical protein